MTSEEPKPKRGRGRPRKGTGARGMYFDSAESHIVEYLSETDIAKRNRVFELYMHQPIYSMTETILTKYYYHNPKFSHFNAIIGETSEDMISDAMSFLLTVASKYDVNRGTKFFSFAQTVIKHYIQAKYKAAQKKTNTYVDLEGTFINSSSNSFEMNFDESTLGDEMVKLYKKRLTYILKEEDMSDDERRVGYCFLDVLNDYDKHLGNPGSNKMGKSTLMQFINDRTYLDLTEIRKALKRFKPIFEESRDAVMGLKK